MTLLEQYYELTVQEKEIKKAKDELAEKLLKNMQDQQIGTIKTDFGTLTKAQKLVYEYSEDFKTKESELKSKIKELKEKDEQNLTPSITEYITFRLSK